MAKGGTTVIVPLAGSTGIGWMDASLANTSTSVMGAICPATPIKLNVTFATRNSLTLTALAPAIMMFTIPWALSTLELNRNPGGRLPWVTPASAT